MKSNPLVSVAIITYNQKDFLKEAIESVLSQQYEPIEIVVGDDCSSDGTKELLEEYQLKYPSKFILKISSQNKGITANSNEVNFACNGKYVAWLGGDDLMLPEKISTQVAYLESHPNCNILYHNLDVFDSSTGKTLYYFNSKNKKFEGGVDIVIKYGTFNGACATMVRRSAAPDYGFDINIPIASDWLFWVEHLSKGGEIKYIDKVLGRYRRHAGNVTSHLSDYARQGYDDLVTTCDIILKKFPGYKKEVYYRLSIIYRSRRIIEYKSNLIKSIHYNFFNIPSWIMLLVYLLSFKKIKL